jgi:signal peptidase I
VNTINFYNSNKAKYRTVIVWICILMMLCTLFVIIPRMLNGLPPSIFGYRAFTVVGRSMEPTFCEGSILIVKQVDPVDIRSNDIITYYCDRSAVALTTHRVNRIEDLACGCPQFITKGDNNMVFDPVPVASEALVGKVKWVVSGNSAATLAVILPELLLSAIMYVSYLILFKNRHQYSPQSTGRLLQ